MVHKTTKTKKVAPRRKYVAGRKYEQGYLDHLKDRVGMIHRGTHTQSLTDRAKESVAMERHYRKKPYRGIDARHATVANKPRKATTRKCCMAMTPACIACRTRKRKTKK